jgi:uncharacterized protein (DUF433 family)
MVQDWRTRIVIEPGTRSGQPVIRGMRITVKDVFEYLAGGMAVDEILIDFPELMREDIEACFAFAAVRSTRLGAAGSAGRLLLRVASMHHRPAASAPAASDAGSTQRSPGTDPNARSADTRAFAACAIATPARIASKAPSSGLGPDDIRPRASHRSGRSLRP